MAQIKFKNLLGPNKDSTIVIGSLIESLGAAVCIEDAEGNCLLGKTGDGHSAKYPVKVEEEVLGWVSGGKTAGSIADLLSYLAAKESEKKTLGNEVLGLYREINLIYNFAEQLSVSLDMHHIAETTLRESNQLIKASGGAIFLLDEKTGNLTPIDIFGQGLPKIKVIGNGAGIIGNIAKKGTAEIVNDVRADRRVVKSELFLSSIICAPLKIKERVKGIIVLMNTEPVNYTAAELKLLIAIASQTAMAMENALLHQKLVEEATRKIEMQRQELEKAVQERTAEINATLEELKATQQQLVQQEKLASLGQLTAGIAHEIKNPLNFVNNFAVLSKELMQELREEIERHKSKSNVPEEFEEIEDILDTLSQNAEKINHHGKRADSIVRSMLQHSRGKKGERQPTEINALLEEDLSLAYHGMRAQDSAFNIKIEKEFDESIGKLNLIPQEISRVFLNIISNGFYAAYQKHNGAVSGGKLNSSPVLRVCTKKLGNMVEVRIRDNGNGISKDIQDKLFNPFFTTKPTGQGTGLGLSISFDIIVQEHGGQIAFETKEGEFTEFIITLPK